MSPAKPWDACLDESPEAYHAFLIYRDLGSKLRSIAKTADVLADDPGHRLRMQSREAGKRPADSSRKRYLERWATRHRWVERVAAWDNHVRDQIDRKRIDAFVALER